MGSVTTKMCGTLHLWLKKKIQNEIVDYCQFHPAKSFPASGLLGMCNANTNRKMQPQPLFFPHP